MKDSKSMALKVALDNGGDDVSELDIGNGHYCSLNRSIENTKVNHPNKCDDWVTTYYNVYTKEKT